MVFRFGAKYIHEFFPGATAESLRRFWSTRHPRKKWTKGQGYLGLWVSFRHKYFWIIPLAKSLVESPVSCFEQCHQQRYQEGGGSRPRSGNTISQPSKTSRAHFSPESNIWASPKHLATSVCP